VPVGRRLDLSRAEQALREHDGLRDGTISGAEKCDDNNTNSGDGCSADCKIEDGWICPTPAVRCQAAACGDGFMVGSEECDDNNTDSGDGCSDTCHVEPGYFCPTPGAACQKTACGNNVVEGDEGCDDGNTLPWDGCSPTCEREPTCTDGECASVCGDGMILAGDVEECDDGNQRDGDGCQQHCTKEIGWDCPVTPIAAASQLSLPVVFRDFISFPPRAPPATPISKTTSVRVSQQAWCSLCWAATASLCTGGFATTPASARRLAPTAAS